MAVDSPELSLGGGTGGGAPPPPFELKMFLPPASARGDSALPPCTILACFLSADPFFAKYLNFGVLSQIVVFQVYFWGKFFQRRILGVIWG